MSSHWRRYNRYFAPDGHRLDILDNVDDEDTDGELHDSSTPRSDESISLATPERFDSIGKQFRDWKPDAIGEVETKQILDLLAWLLQIDPDQRPSTEDILKHAWFAM